jgi:hypothetical protein
VRNWALTNVIYDRPGDPYTRHVLPITQPLFEAYAARHEMDYVPIHVSWDEAHSHGFQIPTVGTECLYASWPHRIALMERYDGVVYMDADAVILRYDEDICATVSDERPIGLIDCCNTAIMPIKTTPESLGFMSLVWSMREEYGKKHWAEEGACKLLLGRPYLYPGDGQPAETWRAYSHWAERLSVLDDGWNFHPSAQDHVSTRRIMQPGGIWPFERRLAIIKEYAEQGRQNAIR